MRPGPPQGPPLERGPKGQLSARAIVLIIAGIVAAGAVLGLVPLWLTFTKDYSTPRAATTEGPPYKVTYWYTSGGGNINSDQQVTYTAGTATKTESYPTIVPSWRADVEVPAGIAYVQLQLSVKGTTPGTYRLRCGIDVDGRSAYSAAGAYGICGTTLTLPLKSPGGPPSAPVPHTESSAPPPSLPPGCRFLEAGELIQALNAEFGQVMLVGTGKADDNSCAYVISEYTGGTGSVTLTWKPGGKDQPYPGATRLAGVDGAWHADLGQFGKVLVDVPAGQLSIDFASQLMIGHQAAVATQIFKLATPRLK
ncbi:hypothetical protein ACQP00_16605 [Dactylosporangium sp. CS-047395]|uniref:hypothetical protein n=1 Tax=Dactylosporangium sp. CS-047395 TaxID=3239936 RepID=UPI003D8D148A